VPADREKRADKITRDRITGIKGSLKGGGRARSLADAAERASGDARALSDVYREQGEYLDTVMSEWRTEGTERRKLRESIATLQKSLERANVNVTRAIEVAETTTTRVPQSGVLEKVARMEAEEKERARWQREQAARERERQQREREAAERERSGR
jgi:ABC-type transporter Mla subunit MlaD